jgi:transcription factor E
MLDKLLKEIITLVVGKQYEDIAILLNSKEHVNEFLIAKKLNLTINQTRNILYKISNEGLVSSVRKKDKRKGWYTYYWKLNLLKSLEYFKEILRGKINNLNQEMKEKEKKIYYSCKRCGIEVEEENALNTNFSCNECGDVYSIKDNSNAIKDLKKEILRLEDKINLINKEISFEREIIEKKRAKILSKIEKEKQLLKKFKKDKSNFQKSKNKKKFFKFTSKKKIKLNKTKKATLKKYKKKIKKSQKKVFKKSTKKFIKKIKFKKKFKKK